MRPEIPLVEPLLPEIEARLDAARAVRRPLRPHRASAAVETRIAMGDRVRDDLATVFAGRDPPAAVV